LIDLEAGRRFARIETLCVGFDEEATRLGRGGPAAMNIEKSTICGAAREGSVRAVLSGSPASISAASVRAGPIGLPRSMTRLCK